MTFITEILSDASIPASARQQALDRILSDPGIPQSSTTASFWLQDPRIFHSHATPLPKEVDVVIIGSGITGASIARSLLENGTSPSILMLEARSICSGATGRNGGHILETGDDYAELADKFGVTEAQKILRFKLAHLSEMMAVSKELGMNDAQTRKVQFLSVYFGKEPWEDALERLRRFKEGMPDESVEWTSFEGEAIPKEFRLQHARGIIAGPAGALWPYRFVTGVIDYLLQKYPEKLRIEEQTPVIAIEEGAEDIPFYKVKTSRGTVHARHVIHCTNAHVSHLVPGLRDYIFPVRGQMSAQTPGDQFPCQAAAHSWIFNYHDGYDYLIQQPEGQMMLGGGFAQGEHGGLAELGISTDSEMSMYIDIHLSGVLPAVFGRENWGDTSANPIQAMWTGNMAFSSDGFPWVGQLPESVTGRAEIKPGGEWVCAAFNGDGMVQSWLCGKALAIMVLAKDGLLGEGVDSDLRWFPSQFACSKKRLETTRISKHLVKHTRGA